ncbi:multiple epidermal growth factor-like domains protein 6 [Ostrea edulis]|uniref:multiple epidermal growth factor-like domains protein 6 n=1 Tax=Ostrea edulis TaxID=37623 RepID=UPI0024AFC66A|nr:multiple epidermal growth factor-like domains protein 6 [Ostrea edulis]
MEAVVFIFLSILLVTVNTTSPQKNNEESCPPWFHWDEDSHQCQSCPIGYYSPNCSLPCRYPSYGERCQKLCNCTAEYCASDKGCINKTSEYR